MGLLSKANDIRIRKLMGFRSDLKKLLKAISDFEKTHRPDEKSFQKKLLKLKRLYRTIEKKGTRRIKVKLVKDFKEHKLDESDLKSFSVSLQSFFTVSSVFEKSKNKFVKRWAVPHPRILYQMAAAANNLITQVDAIIGKEERKEKQRKRMKVSRKRLEKEAA